jgi:hypothetical protein
MSGKATFTIVASMKAITAPSEATASTERGLATRLFATTRSKLSPFAVCESP